MKSQLKMFLLAAPATAWLCLTQSQPSGSPGAESALSQAPDPDVFYRLGPDALPQNDAGVPKGEIRGSFTLPSNAYRGTHPAAPASLMIYNDGQAFMNPDGDVRAQNVMDNLIFRRELPVMIGVFINPGRHPDQLEPNASSG